MSQKSSAEELLRIEHILKIAREQLAIYDAAIAAGQPVPTSFHVLAKPNAHKRRLRSFDEATYKEEAMLMQVAGLRMIEQKAEACKHSIQMMLLAEKRYAEWGLEMLNLFVPQARQELDAADCAEAAALSTSLPRAVGRRAVVGKSVAAGNC